MTASLPCVACGRRLTNCGDGINQPVSGIAFTSLGHYGSTAFDPMDGSMLELNICDTCLRRSGRLGEVLLHEPVTKAQRPPATKWTPIE